MRTERWKYIRYTDFNPPREQLFDLAADLGEENDLASKSEHADMLARLRARCDEYRETLCW